MAFAPKEAKQLLDYLKQERLPWNSILQEAAEYSTPNKNDFNRIATVGEKKATTLYDTTAVHSCQLLSSALHAMLTNPSSFFFGFSTGEPEIDRNDEARHWLDRAVKKTHICLNNSNFQTEIHEVYLDEASIGTAVLYMEKDEEFKLRFTAQHLGNCFFMENNRGIVDTLFRCFRWTAKQCYQEWGDEFPKDILEDKKNNPNDRIEIYHLVDPRELYDNALGPNKMRFSSCYYVESKGNWIQLSEGGYKTFPYAVPRWSKTSGESLGRSPTMNSLADIKMVNKMMETVIAGGELTVRPPLMAPDDGFVRSIKLTPGGINYYRSGTDDRIEPLITNARVDYGYQAVEDVRVRIRQAFFVDQLQLTNGPQMTATEVMQRTEEKLRLMGPVLGRQHFELLKPMIDRVFDILQSSGEFDPPPEILRNKRVEVHYTSAIAKVQQASEILNVQKAMAAISPIAQFAPDVLDVIDPEEAVRFILDKSSLPQQIIRNQDKVDSIRKGKAQAQEEAMQEKAMMEQSEMARNMAPAAAVISKNVAGSIS